jgi:hypothetical protein
MHLAMDIGMQSAKIRDTGSGTHAAEEAITLDQQRSATRPRSGSSIVLAGTGGAPFPLNLVF